MFLSSKLSFAKKTLFAAGLLLALGAWAQAQDIEPGSSGFEAKSKKPPVKTKTAPKSGSSSASKSTPKTGKASGGPRSKNEPVPAKSKVKTKESAPEPGGLLNLEVVVAAAPVYPGAAKQAGAAGTVRVEVLVDETGSVVSAKALDGHELLRTPAENAARATKFMPRKVNGKTVQTRGTLLYCFGANCN